jgi:hypothetical protein
MTICYPTETDWSCYGTAEEIAALNETIKARSEALAWYTLARLTAYRIGVCPTTIRPCAAGCNPMGSWMEAPVAGGGTGGLPLRTIGSSFTPHLTGGNWVNSCGCRTSDCSCSSLSEVLLPGPVGDIESVRIDGITLDRTDYRVDNGYRLVRTDGGVWPACQDMAAASGPSAYSSFSGTYGTTGEYEFSRDGDVVLVSVMPDAVDSVGIDIPDHFRPTLYQVIADRPAARVTVQNLADAGNFIVDTIGTPEMVSFSYLAVPAEPDVTTAAGTFEVTYYQGAAPNDMTRYAAGLLAAEFYRACSGNKKCKLPKGVTSVVRRGVTIEISIDMFENGITGIEGVDAVIGIYNPNHLKQAPQVLSPDRRGRGRRSTWLVG